MDGNRVRVHSERGEARHAGGPERTAGYAERGATIIEFSISAIVLILFFGGLFDLGFAYHRHNYLEHVTARSVRDLLSQLQTTRQCSIIGPYFQQQTENGLALLGSAGQNATWRWRIHPSHEQPNWDQILDGTISPQGQYSSFSVRAEIPWECYFICWVIPSTYRLSATASQAIERENIGCANGSVP